ncbi:MAG: acyltransferase domain-containing protein [Carbonactinosporaceae bacterium]
MLVLVAPGQGAQTPGFLSPWLEVDGVADRLAWWSAVTGLDLIRYGTTADAEEIRDTAVAQPLLVASGLAAALALFPHPGDAFKVVGVGAGHSVGELTAAAGAGVISAESALVLVRERGRAMADAAAVQPTGMTAVLGGAEGPDGASAAVLAKLAEHGLTPANINGAGQIVAAGTAEQLEALTADPPDGARLRPLSVAGAFHTTHMAPAVERLTLLSKGITVRDPRTRLLSNADGAVVHDGHEVLRRIVRQVSNPVRWDLCMQTMADLGATAMIEMPPAGTLTGLARRALPGIEAVALTPADLDAARALVEKHGSQSPLDDSPTWRLVVAPFGGTFHADDLPSGSTLGPGDRVGAITSRRDEQSITVPHGGTVVEWLVEDGDPVSPGQPLVRLHPEAVHV